VLMNQEQEDIMKGVAEVPRPRIEGPLSRKE
jgi:hypothetical protein